VTAWFAAHFVDPRLIEGIVAGFIAATVLVTLFFRWAMDTMRCPWCDNRISEAPEERI
jgi:organic radical activating enzyme